MRRRGILIELTSLLDVILILLFLLLGQMRTQVQRAEEQAETAATEAAQAVTQADLRADALSRELDEVKEELGRSTREELTLGIVAEHSTVLTLSVQDGPVRRIRVEQEGEPTLYLTIAGTDLTAERLRSLLSELLREAGKETAFLVFQYDRNAIYHTEYELISRVIQELKLEGPTLGVALSILETDLQE